MRKTEYKRMKKFILLIVNILLIIGVFVFVVLYSRNERNNDYLDNIISFENMTIAMEKTTENYLDGEQSICDVWANYINSRNMTLEDATAFIHASHVNPSASAHLIFTDTLKGLSTREDITNPGNYSVSYSSIDLFGDMTWIEDVGKGINITRAYTNPMNGKQSLAFINKIKLFDNEKGEMRDALLLRIVPLQELQSKWVYAQNEFKDAAISIINSNGDYIIKGNVFKSSNFYEFYKSYNKISNAGLSELKGTVNTSTGSFTMIDSRGHYCVIAHTPVSTSNGWVMITYIENSNLSTASEDWFLIVVISVVLLILLITNTIYMQALNKKLQQLAKNAESANKAKTDFLSTMSHDIRTPMNAIIGLTMITEKNLDDQKSVRDNLRKISLASNHLLTLINDILDISKVESGKITLNPLSFNIADSIENLVNISQPMIKEKNIDFNVRINGIEKEYLYADQMRLNQIYINILSNAIKYTPSGGVISVDLKQEPSEVPGCVRMTYSVADSGMGMSPEFMKVMFEPFSRQMDSRVNKIQGTGLGLTIVKKMVDLMGGTIDCQSELGKGTTFTIVLDIPLADRQPDQMKLDPIDLLIVDDDEALLATAADTLDSLGVNAEIADCGAKALELVKQRRAEGRMYNVIILDWKMPDSDGVETAKLIREEIGTDIPILLISAYDWVEVEPVAKAAGINGFISKPLFRSTLYTKINELITTENETVISEDDYSDVAGMNVLVAEDNEINWEIIESLLEMYGVTADRAENGRVCVEKLSAAPDGTYDLIFMDVQMPEMNGLDATRAIRKLENAKAASIPIVAMTADAFSENVTECINAGMNAHIAKPVDIDLAIKELRKVKDKRK